MKILSLDTSSNHFSLALIDGKKVLALKTVKNDRVLSSKIIPALESLFKKAGLAPEGIDGIAVGLGPGSFTSLRVGVSTVKGLAFALEKPLIGVPSFDSVAHEVRHVDEDQVCVVSDAKRGLVYAAVYEWKNGSPIRVSDFLLLDLGTLLASACGKVAFTGDGLSIYKDEIAKAGKRKGSKFNPVFLDEKFWYPSAKRIAELAAVRFKNQETDNINTLVPLYLYPQDCQVRR